MCVNEWVRTLLSRFAVLEFNVLQTANTLLVQKDTGQWKAVCLSVS
jgi:hypothetical protein